MFSLIARRTFAMGAAMCFLGFLVIGIQRSWAQHELEFEPAGTRRTGAVDLIIDGKPQVKTPIEILAIARAAKFNEEGSHEIESKDRSWSVKYVPQVALPNATRVAVAEGLLLHKLSIKGKPPENMTLTPGTYYFFVQHINGRWVGVAVDEQGTARCGMFGLIVRDVFSVNLGEEHRPDSFIVTHPIASSEDLERLGVFARAAASDWVDVQIGWEPFGAGCWKQIVCVPGPDQ
jgi:hypothetical protein